MHHLVSVPRASTHARRDAPFIVRTCPSETGAEPPNGLEVRPFSTATLLVMCIALAKLALNVAFHGRYGYFRDELYYIACSEHLDWGYVDHPPLSIFLLAITRRLLGDSLYAIRFPAALAGAVTVVLTALMARKLGGRPFSQLLASTAVAVSPVVLGNGARFFSMNAFDLLFWSFGAYILLSIVFSGKQKLWILYGLVVGLGVMNKYSMLLFGFGTVVGLLLTPRRRDFLGPWIWLGGLTAALVVLPHAAWEVQHGFPSAEFIQNASMQKNAPVTMGEFLVSQVTMTGGGQTLLWLLGLGFFLIRGTEKSGRVIGWMYPVVFTVMVMGNSKAYYLTPIYFPYLAAGAVVIEDVARMTHRAWPKHAAAVLVVLFSLVALPFAVPVLPVDDFVRYQTFLGQKPKPEERQALGDLPQYYADMFGWEEMVAQVAAVYGALTPSERQHAVIFARNYGEAAAIDLFGRRLGLPRALSGHNSYWYWGPVDEPVEVAIVFGDSKSLEHNLSDLGGPGRFEEVELAAVTACEHCMPYENHRMIFLCRGPRFTFKEIWPHERNFI